MTDSLIDVRDGDEVKPEGPAGLGGWLILIGLGLLITPLRALTLLWQGLVPVLQDGVWKALTSPDSPAYQALWWPIFLCEMLYQVVMVTYSIFLLILFFKKHRWFKPAFVMLIVFNAIYYVVHAITISRMDVWDELNQTPVIVRVFAIVVSASIWILYFLVSKRVKNTFVV